MKAKLLGAAALGLLVAACGTNPRERVTGGAAAGAATGAGIGALGGPVGVLAGAAIGGGAGAVTGAVTEPSQVNLGRPVWNDPEVRLPGARSGGSGSASSGHTRQLQQALNSRGFDAGPADGMWGPRTEAAVRQYQSANNMDPTGRPDARMMNALNISSGSAAMGTGSSRAGDRNRAYMGGGMVVNDGTQANQGGMGSGSSPTGRDERMGQGAERAPSGTAVGGGVASPSPMGRQPGVTDSATGAGSTPGQGPQRAPSGVGTTGGGSAAGGPLERRGAATDADPGTGGTGGSGGGATGTPRR